MFRLLLSAALALIVASCGVPTLPGPLPDRADLVVQGVNYVGVVVSDLEAATSFYTGPGDLSTAQTLKIANNELLNEVVGRDVSVNTRMLRSVNGQIRLMEFDETSADAMAAPLVDINGPGFSHVCFQAAKEKGTHERFLAAGASPLGEPGMVPLNPRNPVEYAYLRDQDGTIIEVEHVDIAELNLDAPPKNDHRLRHVAIATPDVDRAAAFYSVLMQDDDPRRIGGSKGFGGDNVDHLAGLRDARIRMAWFQIRNLEFEIGQYPSHPTQIPESPRPVDALGYNMIVFDVSDLESAKQLLLQAGGTVVSEVGELDGGEIFFGRDMDSNLLGFQKAAANSVVSAQNFEDNGA